MGGEKYPRQKFPQGKNILGRKSPQEINGGEKYPRQKFPLGNKILRRMSPQGKIILGRMSPPKKVWGGGRNILGKSSPRGIIS